MTCVKNDRLKDSARRKASAVEHVVPRTVLRRLMLSVVPAVGMTSGLFVAMAGLIAVDFKPAEASEPRLIGAITPQPIEEEEVNKRPKIELIEAASQPPCLVSMDVSAKGRPYNVMADCTDAVFEREAVRAIGRVEFRPKIVDGAAVQQRNVVYPLSFSLQ